MARLKEILLNSKIIAQRNAYIEELGQILLFLRNGILEGKNASVGVFLFLIRHFPLFIVAIMSTILDI